MQRSSRLTSALCSGADLLILWLAIVGMAMPIAADDELSPEETRVGEQLYFQVWGEGEWNSPRLERAAAIEAFDAALQQMHSQAGQALVWELRADYFRVRGEIEDSLAASRVIYQHYPESSRHQNALQEVLKHTLALGQYEELLEISLQELSRTTDPHHQAQFTIIAAQALRHLGDSAAGIKLILERLSKDPERREVLIEGLRSLGSDALISGDYPSALSTLRLVYSLSEDHERDLPLLSNLATLHVLTNDREGAIVFHEEALKKLEHDPRRVAHMFSLALILDDLEKSDQARALYASVVQTPADFDGAERLRETAATRLAELSATASSQLERVPRTSGWVWYLWWAMNAIVIVGGGLIVLLRSLRLSAERRAEAQGRGDSGPQNNP